ncbi:MAG: DUF4097 domain-containing protein [Oscillospiraceae bacterium]|nr:DUF4097 domain-containing protein [Oscillospiraceae bacterium]
METKVKTKMKIVWKIIIVSIVVGIIVSIIGLTLGASRSLYVDRTGVHITGSGISSVIEPNLTPFKDIYIDAGFSDIEFINSDTFGIELYGNNMEWTWSHENGVLNITHEKGSRIQILQFGFNSAAQNYVRIHLPAYADLDIVNVKTGSGKITMGEFNARSLEINNTFGNVDINNITVSESMQIDLNSGRFTALSLEANNLIYNNRFGDGRFQDVKAKSIRAEANSGDLQFTNCEFGSALILNSFGKVTATGLITSNPNIRVNSGDINISGDISGEIIIHNEFGSIKLTTSGEKINYSYEISVKFGRLTFDGERRRDQTSIISGSMLENHIKITSSSGDVEVAFGG